MLNVIVWIALGALMGGMVSLFLRSDGAKASPIVNVVASVVGAVIGGAAAHLIGDSALRVPQVLSYQAVLLSAVGAMALLLVANLARSGRNAHW